MYRLLTTLCLVVLPASLSVADMLRFASGYPSTSQVDEMPYIASEITTDFETTWRIVGMNIEISTPMKLETISGVGGFSGATTPLVGTPVLNIYSSPENFRTSNLLGDVYSGNMRFFNVEEFSQESSASNENYYIEMLPIENIVLDVGSYVFAVSLELVTENWAWVYSIEDLGSDLFVDSFGTELFNLDDFSDTGTVAVDIFATPIPDGDYDFDGDVDGADYLKWQSAFGSTTELDADGNKNGVIDAADYTIWRDNFGAGQPVSTSSIPEPATASLVTMVALMVVLRRNSETELESVATETMK